MRNTKAQDEHLRESYRKRLDEIFALAPEQENGPEDECPSVSVAVAEEEEEEPVSAASVIPVPELVPEPARVAATPAAATDLRGAATRIAQSLTDCLSAAVHELEEKQAADTGQKVQSLRDIMEDQAARLSSQSAIVTQTVEAQAGVRSRLDAHDNHLAALAAASAKSAEAHSDVLARLQMQDSQIAALSATAARSAAALEARLKAQDEGLDRLEAALARSAETQAALQAHLVAQAETLSALTTTISQLAQSHQATQARMDAQADALRQMNARAGNQQTMLDHYREAVERLRDITTLPGLPVQLPDNL